MTPSTSPALSPSSVRMDLHWLWRLTWAAQAAMTGIGLEEWVRAIEPWVTQAMASAPRSMKRWLIWFFANQAGISPNGLRLVSGHDRQWRCPGGKRCPDLLLVDAAGNIRVVIEVKARARLNGDWGYCRQAPTGYSDQLICYGHGCWARHGLSGAKFLLVAPAGRWPHLRKDQAWAVNHYDGTVGPDPWVFVDLELLYQGLISIATKPGRRQAHAAALVRLMAAWWWRLIPVGVPHVVA